MDFESPVEVMCMVMLDAQSRVVPAVPEHLLGWSVVPYVLASSLLLLVLRPFDLVLPFCGRFGRCFSCWVLLLI